MLHTNHQLFGFQFYTHLGPVVDALQIRTNLTWLQLRLSDIEGII